MIIGLDSMTWDVLDPVIARGAMPRLAGLREGGTSGVLQSTEPPVTPAAWSTMMTGVMPGLQGVLGFEDYNSKNNSLKFSGSGSIRCETMWSYLGRLGYKVVSLNLPHTYPPYEVNGIMVAGYGSPGIEYDSTYPADFKEKVQAKLDEIIGQLVQMTTEQSGLVAVLSDHGFGPTPWVVNVNVILAEWGYIKRAGALSRAIRRTRLNIRNFKGLPSRQVPLSIRLPVDWGRTRAIVVQRPIYSSVHLNVKDRQPGGIVQPGDEYNQLIAELKDKFENYTNPINGELVFEKVIVPKDDFDTNEPEVLESYGDLMLVHKPHYRTSSTLKASRGHIAQLKEDNLNAAWHYPNGLFILNGQGIQTGKNVDADICDIIPTLYTWLGMPIPAEVDGQPIIEAFNNPPAITKNKTIQYPDIFFGKQKTTVEETQEEQDALAEQLKNLGYLD